MRKKQVAYLDKLDDYTLLGLEKTGKRTFELFVEYTEPNCDKWVDHICNLPEEAFEINENAIAVFSRKDDEFRLKAVYDFEYHRFVVKDKVERMYKEKFNKHYKVKQKVG